jgi:hypothetical protein
MAIKGPIETMDAIERRVKEAKGRVADLEAMVDIRMILMKVLT